MYRHAVCCSHPTCSEPASYKVAAGWSDGGFTELKTYGFACSEHLGVIFREARERRLDYTPCSGEAIEDVAIFRYEHGRRDRQLQRLVSLEEDYRT